MTAQFPQGRLDSVRIVYERYTGKSLSTTETAESVAARLFQCESQWDNGSLRMRFCAFDDHGMRLGHSPFDSKTGVNDTLLGMESAALNYWLGPIVQSAFVFFQPETDRDMVVHDYGHVDWVDFQTIVKTRGGEMFPIRIRCWYHPALEHWVLAGVDKQSSVSLKSIPNAAY